MDSVLVSYPYESHRTLMEEVPGTLWQLSKYGFCIQDSQAINVISNGSNESSPQNTSDQDLKETKSRCGDDILIMKATVTERANDMSVETGTTANTILSNVSDDHQTDLFVRVEQINDQRISLRDGSISHMTSLRALFYMYGFDYSRETTSLAFHPKVSCYDVTTPSTGSRQLTVRF